MLSILLNPQLDFRTIAQEYRASLAIYPLFAPSIIKADVGVISAMVSTILNVAKRSDYDVNDPRFRAITDSLVAGGPEYAPFLQAFNRLSIYESTHCKERG